MTERCFTWVDAASDDMVPPETVRAILSGVRPPTWHGEPVTAPALVVSAPGPLPPTPGLSGVEHVLPGLVGRAATTGVPFALVMARPTAEGSAGSPIGPAATSHLEDLASALAASLAPGEELLVADDHLALVLPGGLVGSRRRAARVARRAAAQGAPGFAWAAARCPRDATSAAALVAAARRRLEAAAAPRSGRRLKAWTERASGRRAPTVVPVGDGL